MNALITVLAGDGIGPEVTAEAVKVLQAIASRYSHHFQFQHHLIGGAAIDAAGTALPDATLRACQTSDAVLLGAVGGPQWDIPSAKTRPEQGLLAIRKGLGLFANVRPVAVSERLASYSTLKPEVVQNVDLIVIRELTGGIYFGAKKRESSYAEDVCSYTEEEIVRIVRKACEVARLRKKKVTSVDKANVLETSRLWRAVAQKVVAEEFPDITLEHMLVDAAAMHLIKRPKDFDVIVTENMFGDILTDEASMLAGSLGMLPSASLGSTSLGLYEPIHGSAPDIAGKNIANPYATILSAAMLLRMSLKLETEAQAIETAVGQALDAGALTADLTHTRPVSTSEAGQAVLRFI
jgi:3-isopropylmalate dehydrogenase